MNRIDKIAIVGVGLIGGSIGLAVQQRNISRNVVGIGRRRSSLGTARRLGCVTGTTTNLESGVADADLVVICTPVETVADLATRVAEASPANTVITDAGSTKASIVEAIEKSSAACAKFVGSHPLAGSDKTGPSHARNDLYQDRVCVVTPTKKTDEKSRKSVTSFWNSLGSRVVEMSPKSHDSALAATSHLPHLIAAALAGAIDEQHFDLVGGGWRDTTRIAAGDVELWRQILSDNAAHTLKALDKFEKLLAAYRRALERNDQCRLAELLSQGKDRRDAVGN